jgi:rubrerythrin
MSLITERIHNKRLQDFGLNVKTKYKSGTRVLERNSDNSHNDNIVSGVVIEKDYLRDNKIIHKSFNFDPRIEYHFLFESDQETIKCPNCGNTEKVKDFLDGCPYCGTHYNMDFTEKELSTKYHVDNVMKDNKYIIVAAVLSLIFSIFIMFLYIRATGRTFNIYDKAKVAIFGLGLGAFLFYVFYTIDAYIVTLPVLMYKNRENQKQLSFWQKMDKLGIDRKNFFNNFNYELEKVFYNEEDNQNIIDYDIIDYLSYDDFQDKDGLLNVKIRVLLRTVQYQNRSIKEKRLERDFVIKRVNEYSTKLESEINIKKCPNCGASLDLTKDECEYCGTKNNHLQEWYLVK